MKIENKKDYFLMTCFAAMLIIGSIGITHAESEVKLDPPGGAVTGTPHDKRYVLCTLTLI